MIEGNRYEHCYAQLGEDQIWESWQVKLLGITLENQLKLDSHVLNICKKAGRKLSALTRMMPYLSFEKKRNLMKTFFESQFKYSPLVWMFHNRELNNKINRLHERALRLIFNNQTATFEELLLKDNSSTVHERNLEVSSNRNV